MEKYLLVLTIFFSFNLISFSQVLEVKTMSEALNYAGDRNAVKKLIITDSIKGTDYSEGSEWREFRTLDSTFPNIEAVEILADQDIPNHMVTEEYVWGLFRMRIRDEYDNDGRLIMHASLWLKYFSAPNVKYIGTFAFDGCENLESVNFPNAETLGIAAFGGCESLVEVNFPNVKNIGNTCFAEAIVLKSINFPKLEDTDWGIFLGCTGLETIRFGIDFTELKEIRLGHSVFGDTINMPDNIYGGRVSTDKVKLTLGKYVLPSPNLLMNTWQGTNRGYNGDYDYTWQSVEIDSGIEDEKSDTVIDIFSINKNIYYADNISELELYDLSGREIRSFNNQEIIDLNGFSAGVYFFKYIKNLESKTEKIVVVK